MWHLTDTWLNSAQILLFTVEGTAWMMVGLSVLVDISAGSQRRGVYKHTQPVRVCICLPACDSSVCVCVWGVRALAGGEPRGSRLIPPVIGFWSGPCSSVIAN